MLNNVILVGRLVEDPEVRKLDSGLSVCTITLAVTRGFKNSNGEVDVDFIKCTLWEGIASAAAEYCKKGSIIGVKGRLISKDYVLPNNNDGDEKIIKIVEVVGERVSFIKI